MIVTRLKLTNVRAIEVAEFSFKPGFNLIVGVNGVGKTTVLDSLAVCLSAITRQINQLKTPGRTFAVEDIRVGADTLSLDCAIEVAGKNYTFLVHKPRFSSVGRKGKKGIPREQVYDTPSHAEFLGSSPPKSSGHERNGRPLAVLFSTRRALASDRGASKSAASGGVSSAFAEAYSDRELRLGESAAWLQVQRVLEKEVESTRNVIRSFEEAVSRFLPGYSDLQVVGGRRPTLRIEHGRATLSVSQLSDGERGMLAIVMDLTRRLAQANPGMKDPAATAQAVVLIDEVDLHLHPRWQREVVRNLTAAFPKCQFIATTHSPQVIGEVEQERIQIIVDGKVYPPSVPTFGVDSSRVLEEVMQSRSRTKEVEVLLTDLSQAFGEKKLGKARTLLARLVKELGENDPEVTRAKTLIEFMED